MSFTVEPLSADLPFGRAIRGLTAQDLNSEAVREQLRAAWFEHGFLMFEADDITPEFHLELSKVFGPLQVHRSREYNDEKIPELLNLSSTADPTEIEVDGEAGGQWQSWHKDLIYADKVNRGGILRSLQPTSRGGLTGFVDLADAYDRLPEATKRKVEDRRLVYRMSLPHEQRFYTRSKVRILKMSDPLRNLFDRRDKDYPPVSHPLVYTMPESGRKILNFSPGHAMFIEGLSAEESDGLLYELSAHIFDSPAYHHKWSTREMLLWDNWRMIHMVSLIPSDEVRIMQRTTIAGDYGVGRPAPEAVIA